MEYQSLPSLHGLPAYEFEDITPFLSEGGNMPIPKTMKAAIVEKFGEPLALREIPVPELGPGQALVEIIASGVCHTDLHAADGDWPVKPNVPFTPGHEGAGLVVALGPDVTHLKEGDRVGLAWLRRRVSSR
jgi:alcohol dehydrogenase, propanol-preferring